MSETRDILERLVAGERILRRLSEGWVWRSATDHSVWFSDESVSALIASGIVAIREVAPLGQYAADYLRPTSGACRQRIEPVAAANDAPADDRFRVQRGRVAVIASDGVHYFLSYQGRDAFIERHCETMRAIDALAEA